MRLKAVYTRAESEKRARALIAFTGAALMLLCLIAGGLLPGEAAEASAKERAAETEAREQWIAEQAVRLRAELSRAEDDAYDKPAWEYVGEFRIFHYCPCEKCCGRYADGITRTGTKATAGRTASVDPAVIPLGSEIRVGEHVYIAEDTGVTGNCIDIFVDDHDEALRLGTYRTDVWVR